MPAFIKRVLIVSPHFPPINAPDHQRIRTALPFFNEFGWQPCVLAVQTKYVEGISDPLLEKTIPASTGVVRARALPQRWTRLFGMGSVALRALPFLWSAGGKLLRNERGFDLIFFSTTMFPVLILGPLWKRKYGIPYVVDYQDPWHSDYYKRTHTTPPGGRLKYWVSCLVARVFEPLVVRSADEFVVVSKKYEEELLKTYAFLRRDQFTTLPFGAPELDFELLRQLRNTPKPAGAKRFFEIVYMGAAGPFMAPIFRLFFSAVMRSREKNPSLWQTVRFKFIGTSYAPAGRAKRVVEPIAIEFDLQDIVEEQTDRVPYFDALAAICRADGLLIIGSESSSYSPSKVFPYVLARRPTLAILHRDSPAVEILGHCRAANIIEFDEDKHSPTSGIDLSLAEFMRDVETGTQPSVDWSAFSKYSAREMTRKLVAVFNRAADKRG
ncbi:MAG: hypothetical protein DME42_05380 [Verrucomicrobia bacterium]|nr:MAG: hypothetical protein DME42_05380 [Verrucomicrobiota bacterium]